jgi:type IV fimbrial biogenesis protein FimT
MRHRACAPRGFTMIELAVTLALLGILFALGLPSFMSWVRNSQVRTVADMLQGGVRRAQTEAVRMNQPVVLFFTNVKPDLNAAAVAGGKNWSVQSIAQFDKAAVFLTGGALADAGSNVTIAGTSNALCFNSNGRLIAPAAPGVPGAVCIAGPMQFDVEPYGRDPVKGDRRLRVLVAIGGQVHMCDPDRPTLSATSPDGCP